MNSPAGEGRESPDVDIIAAIATPPGRGGVGVVRVSGTNLDAIVDGIIGRALVARTASVATFLGAGGASLDQGLALLFSAPASYTGETVLELHGHGSPVGLRAILARCVELGARHAEPGEFTKRAFLNGKLDLAQAESVADLIEAATETAARAAVRSLSGEFSREVRELVDALTRLRMFTEATLDFPDEDIDFIRTSDASATLARVRADLDRILVRAVTGARLNEGLMVVLVGRPNVGKSSLLNRLVREEAAIVTPIAGTTRDTVERQVEIGGIPLTIVDTAGLRAAPDEVEQIGIARTWAAVERADLVVVLVDARDATDALPDDDRAIVARLPQELPRLVVHNKVDLVGGIPRVESLGETRHVWLSALTGAGLDLIEREVLDISGVERAGEDTFIARERHLVALGKARAHLAGASAHLDCASPPLELYAEELREAQLALSSITGEFTADDLLGAIFSRFCIGK